MAIGKDSDFVIFQDEFYGGQYEAMTQNANAFNGASNNGMIMQTRDIRGNYGKESFLKELTSLVTRRDLTSVSAATDIAMTMDEFINVKINRKIGPVAQTLGAWRKISADSREMSFQLGRMIGEQKAKDMVSTAIGAVEAALQGQATATVDKTAASVTTLCHAHLVAAMNLRGDKANEIVCWVMHSKPFFDLVGAAISDNVTNVADAVIYGGGPGTLGKPVVVTDAAQLLQAGSPNSYPVLGLVQAGVSVIESEQQDIYSEIVTGLEQLALRVQGEYAFNIGVKGFKWDVTNGGTNPTDANVFTTTNWDVAGTSDVKRWAGVRLLVA